MDFPRLIASSIERVVNHETDFELQFFSTDGANFSVRMPLIEVFELLNYLQQVFRRGEDFEHSYPAWDATLLVPDCKKFQNLHVSSLQGVAVHGSRVSIQWTDDSQDWQELSVPTREAYQLMRLLEDNLPLGREPTHDINVRFGEPIAGNDLVRIWRPAYRVDRYLKNLADKELRSRTHHVIANTMRLGDDRKFRPVFLQDVDGNYVADRGIDWLRLLTDVHTELEMRGREIDLKPRADEKTHIAERLADETWCWRPDLVDGSTPSSAEIERPKMIFKYGKQKWNRKIIENGIVRITPASIYDDPSLNSAIEDDELSFYFYDKVGNLRTISVNNYYVFCVSGFYDYRLFVDFEADSCLAIRDVKEFEKRLFDATKKQIKNSVYHMVTSPVIYMDPFNLKEPKINEEIYFGKNFRYAYQHEFRFVWRAKDPKSIKPLELEIGDITDIAELIAK